MRWRGWVKARGVRSVGRRGEGEAFGVVAGAGLLGGVAFGAPGGGFGVVASGGVEAVAGVVEGCEGGGGAAGFAVGFAAEFEEELVCFEEALFGHGELGVDFGEGGASGAEFEEE